MRAPPIIAAAALLLLALGAGAAQATSLQPIGEFEEPVYVTAEPGNANRVLVVERKGTIEAVEGGSRSLFADISSEVSCCVGEGGLLSIALPDDFDVSGRLYVYYTGKEETPAEIHVAELQNSGAGPLRNLLTIPTPSTSTTTAASSSSAPKATSSSRPATAVAPTTPIKTPRA